VVLEPDPVRVESEEVVDVEADEVVDVEDVLPESR
jgi:hypothetical protein